MKIGYGRIKPLLSVDISFKQYDTNIGAYFVG
jgi:hypothetical protein